MLNKLSRTTPHTQFNRTFDKLATRNDNSHFSARRIGGRMLAMCGLSAMYVQGGVLAQTISGVTQNLTYYPLAIWGLMKKPFQLATAIGLTVSFPNLADSFADHLPFFMQQYEFITLLPALLLSSGMETARVIYGKLCSKQELTQALNIQMQDYVFSSQDIADKLVKLPRHKGSLVFAHSIIRSLMNAEDMSWKAEAIIKRLEEYSLKPKSRTTKQAKKIINYLEKNKINVKFSQEDDDI